MPIHDNTQSQVPSYSTPLAVSAPSAAIDDLDDLALVRQVANQDAQAFETLYNRYAPKLRMYLTRSLPPHAHIDEVLNDVMMVLWRGAARVPPSAPLAAWLFGIARYRIRKAWSRAPHCEWSISEGAEEANHSTPEGDLLRRERYALVDHFLDRLSADQREMIALAAYNGLTCREISRETNTNVNTIKSRLSRVRRRLLDYVATQG